MSQMKDLTAVLSRTSWLVVFFGYLPLIAAVFQPTLKECGIFIAVDYAALILTNLVDRRLFLRLYPDVASYFLGFNHDEISKLNLAQKEALFESMVNFPGRRALYSFSISYFKMIPTAIVVVFFWHHETSNAVRFAQYFLLSSLTYTYFYGASYIETHDLTSRKIAELHARYHWDDVFLHANLKRYKVNFELQERLVLFSIGVMLAPLQILLILSRQSVSNGQLAFQVAAVAIGGLMLISRVWYVGRRYFVGGLEKLFESLEKFEPERLQEAFPLHSSSILARFEKTFNRLLERLRSYEQELSHWIFVQTEQSRFRALGEISALIVHDLSAPLHVIKFCTEQLKEHPELIQNPRYIEQLAKNGARSLELIDSLKAYLKNQTSGDSGVTYGEAHEHVVRLLEAQFSSRNFKTINISAAPELAPLRIDMARAEFIHVLLNLMANAIENLLTHSIPGPFLAVTLNRVENGKAEISFRDNGTGLGPEKFEQLTALAFLPAKELSRREGLGLRLVRRLVERSGGEMKSVALPSDANGTIILLKIGVVADGQKLVEDPIKTVVSTEPQIDKEEDHEEPKASVGHRG